MSQSPDDIRRRQMMQQALTRGLQRPSMEARLDEVGPARSFMPGESAGMPDSYWLKQFPFLRDTQAMRESQPGYAPLGSDAPKPPISIPSGNAGLSLPRYRDNDPALGSDDPRVMSKPIGDSRYAERVIGEQGQSVGYGDERDYEALGLRLPSPPPTNPNISMAGVPPEPTLPTTPPASPRIGYSTSGLTGVDRLTQRRRALEEADPESRVTDTGEIEPPQKTGRLKGFGQLAGLAAAQADPDRPMYALGQILGGGITGLASPRSAAKAQRQFDIRALDSDIARGLKLEQEQAQLDQMRGPKPGQMSTRVVTEGEYPGIEAGTEIRTRIDSRTGEVIDVMGRNQKPVIADLAKRPSAGAPHYESDAEGYLITVQGGRAQRVLGDNGQPVKVKSKNADGEVVEVEVNGRTLRVTPGQALNYYGQIGEKESKFNAAKSEYDSLIVAEESARQEKDRAYKVLDEMRKSGSIPKEDIEQAQRAAADADAFYRSFGEKKKDAARRMQENQVSSSASQQQPYAGRTMSRANLERYAKDKGMSIEDAQREVEAQGVRVQ